MIPNFLKIAARPSARPTLIDMVSSVSFHELHRLTPIKQTDHDDVLDLLGDFDIDPRDSIWHIAQVPVEEIDRDPVGRYDVPGDAEVLDSISDGWATGAFVPPAVLMHYPSASRGQYVLLDGAHRWTVAHTEGLPTLLSWVAHHNGCCQLARENRRDHAD